MPDSIPLISLRHALRGTGNCRACVRSGSEPLEPEIRHGGRPRALFTPLAQSFGYGDTFWLRELRGVTGELRGHFTQSLFLAPAMRPRHLAPPSPIGSGVAAGHDVYGD